MTDSIKRIDALDISLFDPIPSQTSPGDRRSLLGVQRAIARRNREYVYLEIGSHLGGSIQPHLCDDRCKKIYSIDPRPSQQPDDRSPGHVAFYENNSTERMLSMLARIGHGNVAKIECFDCEAPQIDPGGIAYSPMIAFIDGEHTKAAAIADFQFCIKVLSKNGVVLFHDFSIIHPAVLVIVRQLKKSRRRFSYLKLEGEVFAIFFDPGVVNSDPYLNAIHRKNRHFWLAFSRAWLNAWLKNSLRRPLHGMIQNFRRSIHKDKNS